MTLKKRYDEIMEHIEVTEEMRLRILEHLQTIPAEKKPSKAISKKLLPFAACLVLLIGGAFAVTALHGDSPEFTEPGVQGPENGIVTVSSLQALSDCLGFDVLCPKELPFEAEEITYASYWNNLAQITYYGNNQSAVFRQSLGREDNSGDYTSYAMTKELTVDSLPVTIKGDSPQQLRLAVWSDNEFTFSLSLSQGSSLGEWENILSHISP